MNVILLGPPGSGKGTQGEILARRIGVPRISTGDLLRNAVERRTPLGQRARSYMDQGLLVPDEVIIGLIDEVLSSREAAVGVVMDGFPRTVTQAEAVDRSLAARERAVDHVVNIVVPENELLRRMIGRAREQGRSDDTEQTIRQRLRVYEEQTAPLVQYYEARALVRTVDGLGDVEEIARRAQKLLGL